MFRKTASIFIFVVSFLGSTAVSADIVGKGLVCINTSEWIKPEYLMSEIRFNQENLDLYRLLAPVKDKVELSVSSYEYMTTETEIVFYMIFHDQVSGKLLGEYKTRIDRKTLTKREYVLKDGGGVFALHKCEVLPNPTAIDAEIQRINKENRAIYDERLKGNKL